MRRWICALICVCVLAVLPVCGFATEEETEETTISTETTEHEHSYGGWTNSGDGHTGTCSCGETSSEGHAYAQTSVTTQATCTTDGEKLMTCGKCGATKNDPITATGHTYTYVKIDDNNHKVGCTNCSLDTTEAHAVTSTTTDATCLATGKTVKTCSKCTYRTEEEIPISTTHAYGAWGGDEQNHSRTCSVCTKVDSGAHSWGTGTVVTAATCKAAGVKSYTCSVCSQILYEDIAKLTTHTYDNDCDDTCNVCENKRTAAHKFAQEWTTSSTGHWYACLFCGEKKEHLDHVPGPAATEFKEQTCLICNYVLKTKLNHVHSVRKEWKSDKQGHWHTCAGCSLELDFSKHNYGTGCDGCKDCGYVDPSMHIYDGVWELDHLNHWGTCTVCGNVSELQAHIPGPEATEDAPQTCTVCGYVIAEYQAHEHQSTGKWYYNDADHWNVCECGEKLDIDPHIWDSGTKNKDKTITYECAMCDAVKTEAQSTNSSGFPWGVLLVILIILLAAAFGTLAWILLQPKQSGKFTE